MKEIHLEGPGINFPCFGCGHYIPREILGRVDYECDILRDIANSRRIYEATGLILAPVYDVLPDGCFLMEHKASDAERSMLQEEPGDVLETIKRYLCKAKEDIGTQIMDIRMDPTLSKFQKWRLIRELKRRKKRT